MKKSLTVGLCGIGGYGEWYLQALLNQACKIDFRLVGVSDPQPHLCSFLSELVARDVPIFESLEDFYAKLRCDLLIIATPLHLHCHQTRLALAHGSHVLCEKPLCSSIDQIKLMERAQEVAGKTVTVGYQWSFSPAIRRFKRDRLAGVFGDVRKLHTMVCWPRDEYYYQRNKWAGRQYLEPDLPVLDSPVNNAAAHYLHNMLYVLGPEMSKSAMPKAVEAELWRANSIENFDTAAMRIELESGADAYFYTSHATEGWYGPSLVYEFEHAVVEYGSERGRLIAKFRDGRISDYGDPEADPYEKLWQTMDSATTGRPSICGIEAAKAHSICVNWAQESANGIRDFPTSTIRVTQSERSARRYVANLQEMLYRCYRQGKLLREDEEFVRLTEVTPSTRRLFGSVHSIGSAVEDG